MVIVVSDALRMMKDSAMRLTLSRQKKMSDKRATIPRGFLRLTSYYMKLIRTRDFADLVDRNVSPPSTTLSDGTAFTISRHERGMLFSLGLSSTTSRSRIALLKRQQLPQSSYNPDKGTQFPPTSGTNDRSCTSLDGLANETNVQLASDRGNKLQMHLCIPKATLKATVLTYSLVIRCGGHL
uniref:Uncharacterized protein n=1 Tax=Salix viminalis TaxID=40686 RepID=A0A6N2KFH7_SALVM